MRLIPLWWVEHLIFEGSSQKQYPGIEFGTYAFGGCVAVLRHAPTMYLVIE